MSFINVTSDKTTSLYMFPNFHAPGNFVLARMLSLASALIILPMLCLFFVIAFKAFRKKQHGRKSERMILGFLLGNLICSIWTISLGNLSASGFSGIDANICYYWGRLGGFFYVFSNFFTYCILLKRCQTLSHLRGTRKFEKLVFKLTLIGVKFGTACVPLLGLFCLAVFEGKTYFIEEYCIEGVSGLLSWIFLLLDTSLSSGYFLLFILPVAIHMRSIKSVTPMNEVEDSFCKMHARTSQKSSSDTVKATAVRNLKISSTAISSTFICMLGVSLASTFVSSQNEEILPHVHFNLWQFYAGAADLLVNAICNMLMTKRLWKYERPKRETGVSDVAALPKDNFTTSEFIPPPPSSLGLFA